MPGLSPGKSGDTGWPNPKRATNRLSRSVPTLEADLDRADVARLDDDVGERQHAVVVMLASVTGLGRPAMWMTPGLVSIIVSIGITFSSIAADAVTTLNVEPGS